MNGLSTPTFKLALKYSFSFGGSEFFVFISQLWCILEYYYITTKQVQFLFSLVWFGKGGIEICLTNEKNEKKFWNMNPQDAIFSSFDEMERYFKCSLWLNTIEDLLQFTESKNAVFFIWWIIAPHLNRVPTNTYYYLSNSKSQLYNMYNYIPLTLCQSLFDGFIHNNPFALAKTLT